MSDLNLLITYYLSDEESKNFLNLKDKNALRKYKIKEYVKWSEIKKNLPVSIVENLIYDSAMPIKKLPDTILNLKFTDLYDYDLENLPPKLQILDTGSIFNSPIKIESLPKSLTSLTLNEEFKQKIDELPSQLKFLRIFDLDPKIININSENLETLVIANITSCHCCRYMPACIPKNIKTLVVTGSIVKTLYFKEGLQNLALPDKNFKTFEDLPKSLQALKILSYNGSLEGLHSIHTLTLDKYNKDLKNLPSTLTHLNLGDDFDHLFELPDSLQTLIIGNKFNRNIDNLSPNLTYLSLGNLFSQSLDKLPQSLRHLSIGDKFCKPLTMLPKLKSLTLGSNFENWINKFPITLESLSFLNNRTYEYMNMQEETAPLTYYNSEIAELKEFAHLPNLKILKIDIGTKMYNIIFGDSENDHYKTFNFMSTIIETFTKNESDKTNLKSAIQIGMQFAKLLDK